MAIVEGMVTAAKLAFLRGVHREGDEYAIALYTENANLGPNTAAYTSGGEVVGRGYKSGGKVLQGTTTGVIGRLAYMHFENPEWPNSTIEAHGALIYNRSKNNAALTVIDFGENLKSSAGMFRVLLPEPDASGAIIWIG